MERSGRRGEGGAGRRQRRVFSNVLTTALLVAVLLGVAAWRFDLIDRWWPAGESDKPLVRIGSHGFRVELATDPAARARGLGGRAALPAGHGMLFVYRRPEPPEEMSFWMKGCLIDLDIAFISADRRIVTIHTMQAEPGDRPDEALAGYRPTGPSQFALEVPAGELARLGVKVGDVVEFPPAVEQAIAQAK